MAIAQSLTTTASLHYTPFIRELFDTLLTDSWCEVSSNRAIEFVEGEADVAVEKLVPYETRSEQGIFFTADDITVKIVNSLAAEVAVEKSFFDPSCGAGNLLLGIAKSYPIKKNLNRTIEYWSKKFGGCDLHDNFVIAAKLRLIALAAIRHGLPSISEGQLASFVSKFDKFYTGDYLEADVGGDFDCVVANPPFGHVVASRSNKWSSGRTQLAAIFVDKIISSGKKGQKLVAVLPDVLRSGSRYERWREKLAKETSCGAVELHGRFSKSVDVDVFILNLNNKPSDVGQIIEWVPPVTDTEGSVRLGDLFLVRVGPVVPHRLEEGDEDFPFLCAKNAPAFGVTCPEERIKFGGTKFLPPFVVVRRTSNPCDKNRLITTLVKGIEPVAVENHLVVMKPFKGGVSSCLKLIKALKDPKVTSRLNNVIRCRHLTTKSISSMVLQGV
ncbi:N-6 DNA methylase [Pseudomonas atacamensis]|uniref:N-6 DNA methylase n=1 Tax=Pseudomonas atacamensis TaxID=2565368 RepID=UPI00215F0B62|nr:N-6 DNA methylase [Pseudomonas atacamensis]UVL97983.1 N-6 DNA methylase [Pseudomonas atacamensis]